MVAYPDIASAPRSEARRRTFRFMGIAAVTSGLTVLGLEIAAGRLIPFFFGSTYADAVLPARILLVSALLLGVRRVLGDCARGAGRPVVGSAAEAASWVALIPALAFLAPTHGIVGVAWAVFAASCVSAVTAVVFAFAPRGQPDWRRVVSYAATGVPRCCSRLSSRRGCHVECRRCDGGRDGDVGVGIAMLLAQPGLIGDSIYSIRRSVWVSCSLWFSCCDPRTYLAALTTIILGTTSDRRCRARPSSLLLESGRLFLDTAGCHRAWSALLGSTAREAL